MLSEERMRLLLVCVLLLGLAGCARSPAPADPLATRERICGEERQTSRWHDCNARFLADRPGMLGPAATEVLTRYHGAVARSLLAMEQRRMSQAEGRDVIDTLTETMQRELPLARTKDSATVASRAAVCFPLSGGGSYCTGK
jgi:hypothetical protein